MISAMAAVGLDRAALEAAVGPMRDRLPDAAFSRLWRVAAKSGREALELDVAEALPIGALGPIDVLALSAPTVGAACTLAAAHLERLLGTGVRLEVTPLAGGAVRLAVLNASPVDADVSDVLFFAVLVRALRGRTSVPFEVKRVQLARPRPAAVARWESFFAGQVRFGAKVSAVEVPAAVWRAGMASSSEAVHRALSPLVPEGGSVESAVRATTQQKLGAASLAVMAESLGVSTRTLQRRLKAEGVKVRAVMVEERLAAARRLLAKPGATVKSVAAEVGFSSASALSRALKRK